MSLGWPMQPVTDQSQMPPFLQTSADRYHLEPHPEHLCGACPYAYPPMPPIGPHPGFEDWSQIRYPPPPTAMEHPPPLPNSRLFRLVSPCPLPHSMTHTHRPARHMPRARSTERVRSCILGPLGTDWCAACHPRGRTFQLRAAQGPWYGTEKAG